MCFSLIPYLLVLSDDNLCKWFESRSGSEPSYFDTPVVFLKEFLEGYFVNKKAGKINCAVGRELTMAFCHKYLDGHAWVKVFRINPEFRDLRMNFHRKSASKC